MAPAGAGLAELPLARLDVPLTAGESTLIRGSGVAVREGPLDPASSLALGGGPVGFAAVQDGEAYLPSSVCQSPFDSSSTSSTLSGHVARIEAKNLPIERMSGPLDNWSRGAHDTGLLVNKDLFQAQFAVTRWAGPTWSRLVHQQPRLQIAALYMRAQIGAHRVSYASIRQLSIDN